MGKQSRNQNGRIESVVGVLIPTGWNEQFTVTAMALACDGEREIAVSNLDEHPGLHLVLRKRLRAEGAVFHDDLTETMQLRSYALVEDNDHGSATPNSNR